MNEFSGITQSYPYTMLEETSEGKSQQKTLVVKNKWEMGWRAGSTVRSPGCSSKEPGSDSQHPHGSS